MLPDSSLFVLLLSAILLLLQYILEPEVNAMAYDSGYFYPGPAVEGATLDKAPQASQILTLDRWQLVLRPTEMADPPVIGCVRRA